MSRSFQDPDLLIWEAYATTGAFGASDHAHIIFHCVSDPSRRARYVEQDASLAAAQKRLAKLSTEELRSLLDEAQSLK
ncbi:MAG: hypothetical protein P8099_07610 [Gemmatimonadota bacterium]|jgi:hypothetical protein